MFISKKNIIIFDKDRCKNIIRWFFFVKKTYKRAFWEVISGGFVSGTAKLLVMLLQIMDRRILLWEGTPSQCLPSYIISFKLWLYTLTLHSAPFRVLCR